VTRERRRVDWNALPGPGFPAPALVDEPLSTTLPDLLRELDEMVALENSDQMLRRAVELCRQRIGLERAGIFLLEPDTTQMLGTWGTGAGGAIVSEHHVMYEIGASDRGVFERADTGVARYAIFENCPLVVHLEDETRIIGRAWVACTPLRSARGPVGMLFNDGGETQQAFDEGKQTQAVILCAVLGAILDLTRDGTLGRKAAHEPASAPKNSKVVAAVRLMATQISLDAGALAKQVGMSPSHLARLFKQDMGLSLLEYRQRQRLERFFALVDAEGGNLLAAALDAGFGSYAQFHRVFRARFGQSPRDYLKTSAAQRS